MLRSVTCGELTINDLDREVVLAGWVSARRDHGGIIFIDLRDRYGIIQVVFNPGLVSQTLFEDAASLHNEDVIQITGKVSRRPAGTENQKIVTGEIEIFAERCTVLNRCVSLPFEIVDDAQVSETVRLSYRYLDLRRPAMQRNIILRHKAAVAVRQFLNEQGFVEIETPLLTRSTPEGARDFLVPSRLEPGKFYALPQSPQLSKQILMVAGFDRYFQLARCLRDEDLRSDRQPEHTQIDLEASFVEPNDIQSLVEGLVSSLFQVVLEKTLPEKPFPILSYQEAVAGYGSDKPDLRFDLQIRNVSEIFSRSSFEVFRKVLSTGGQIKAMAVPEVDISNTQMKLYETKAKELGAKGLVWIKSAGEEQYLSPVAKFLGEETLKDLARRLSLKKGVIFLVADDPDKASVVLGQIRLQLAEELHLIPEGKFSFLWVTEFPLFEYSEEEKRLVSVHHPFTAPQPEDIPLLDTEPIKVRSLAYDLVLNGSEIGGGSIRIHQPDLQKKIFNILGIPDPVFQEQFGFLLNALACGAPPHGGLALGFDRLLTAFLSLNSIREVIAFPKTQKGTCLLTGAPAPVSSRQLSELGLNLKSPSNPPFAKGEKGGLEG
ncbi:MAG: aspartate--tRNA ligase [Candidatus Omnitrophota bacterium]